MRIILVPYRTLLVPLLLHLKVPENTQRKNNLLLCSHIGLLIFEIHKTVDAVCLSHETQVRVTLLSSSPTNGHSVAEEGPN